MKQYMQVRENLDPVTGEPDEWFARCVAPAAFCGNPYIQGDHETVSDFIDEHNKRFHTE